MSLLKSKVSVRFFRTVKASVDDVRVALDFLVSRGQVIEPNDAAIGAEVHSGWCAPTHLADANLEAARCIEDGVLRLFYVRAERKVPAGVVNQKLAEAVAEMVKNGEQRPGKKARAKMKENIIALLKPSQAVSRSFFEVWWDFSNGLAVVSNPAESKAAQLAALLSAVTDPITRKHPLPFVPNMGAVLSSRLVSLLNGEELSGAWTMAGPLKLSNDERDAKIGGTAAPLKAATKSCVLDDGMGVDSCVVMAERAGFALEFGCDASGGVRGLGVPSKVESIADRMLFFARCFDVLREMSGEG